MIHGALYYTRRNLAAIVSVRLIHPLSHARMCRPALLSLAEAQQPAQVCTGCTLACSNHRGLEG